MTKKFRDFELARAFAKTLGLTGQKEWEKYCKSGSKPKDIPSNPQKTYKGKGWIGWGYFLGNGRIANQLRQYRPLKEAREFVRSLGLKTASEWREYCASGEKPTDIPTSPWLIYKELDEK
jgi:hypothetical protein